MGQGQPMQAAGRKNSPSGVTFQEQALPKGIAMHSNPCFLFPALLGSCNKGALLPASPPSFLPSMLPNNTFETLLHPLGREGGNCLGHRIIQSVASLAHMPPHTQTVALPTHLTSSGTSHNVPSPFKSVPTFRVAFEQYFWFSF